MRLKPLFVGEAPGPNTKPGWPLFPYPENSAGRRLYDLTCFRTRSEYIYGTDRLNLVPCYPGNKWPYAEARAAAENLKGSGLMSSRVVVLVGSRVVKAFGYDLKPCELVRGVGYLPHPSGRNRWYNDPRNKDDAKLFLATVIDS